MAGHNKTLLLIAAKLGLGQEEKVLSKAAELERLLQAKSTTGSHITDTSKTVICLDLAASIHGADLDTKTAIKYSGLKPSMYSSCKKTLENILELNNDKLTTAVVCLSLQCSSVEQLADEVLLEYQRKSKMDVDLVLPHYVCMAVYQACRINKVKVSKSKLIEKSRLKPGQWAKLDTDWTKFVDEHFSVTKKKRGRPAKMAAEEEDKDTPMELDTSIKEVPSQSIEPYEDWKRRMLETAYEELKVLEKSRMEETFKPKTPRRSPRKTPQKYSPYKSPQKSKGVRLLFPV